MYRVQLGNEEFEGDNNAYVFREDDEVALIDTGVSLPATRETLVEGLEDLGVAVEDVDSVFLTHWHADHVGLAGWIQSQSGATVHCHRLDASLVEQQEEAFEAMKNRQERLFEWWGMPVPEREELLDFLSGTEFIMGDPPDVEPFEPPATWSVAGRELTAVHMPGHTDGLAAYAFEGERGHEICTGDALLPEYTPNVGGADVRVDEPLAKYLDTLAGLVEADHDVAWPGHRGTIIDPAGRAREILQHHRERAERVLDVLDEHGPCDAWTVGAHLFGDLEQIHIVHGPGESYAHLEHLARHGLVASADTPGSSVDYRRVEDPPESLEECLPLAG